MTTKLTNGRSTTSLRTNAIAFLAIVCLSVLVGCQGFSSAGTAPQQQTNSLSLGSAILDFGSVSVGASKTMTVTATNSGTTSITLSGAAVSTKYFALTAPSLPVTIAAGQSTQITVRFTPNASGTFNASAAVTSNSGSQLTNIALAGTGVASAGTSGGQLTLNSASEAFGNVTVGAQQSQTVTLTNGTASNVTISQATVTGAAFQLTGITTPTTLIPSQSLSFTLTFAPSAAGSATGNLNIVSDAVDPSLTMALTGVGVAPGMLGSSLSSLDFGSVTVGSSQSLSETVTNTGGASVTITQAAISGTGFSVSGVTTPITLAAGQSAAFTIKFAPASAATASGTLTVTSTASNPTLTVALSGNGIAAGALGSTPSSVNFGSVTVGSNQSLSGTVTNTGGTSVTISQVAISGTGFTLSSITAPVTLSAGQGTTFTVKFSPASSGSASGSVTVTSNAPNPTLTIPLSASGVAPGVLGSSPTSLNFGNVTVGSNQSLSETVTNTGGAGVTISQVSASGTGFTLSGVTTPLTLTAGQSTTFTVKFAPASAGSASGNVTITSTASNPTLTVPLSGTGVALGTLGSNPTSLNFGSVTVGSNQSLSETVTNTGGASVTISQVAASGTGFSLSGITTPVTLASGQGATFTVKFAPGSSGSASGNVTITSTALNPTLTVPLSGTGVAVGTLGSNPTSLNFGSVTVGSNQSLSDTVTNTGGASVTISQVTASGSGFSLSGITTPVTLTSGQGISFTLTFAPASSGSASGNVTVTSTASNPSLSIPLSGTGAAAAGQLTITPATLNLGSVVVGTSRSASGSLTASGANVTVTAATSNNSVFSLGSLSLPVTIAAGQSVPFTITFSPQTTGTASATLTITSNAQSPTTTEALTGTGTAAPTHTVNLSWNASTSSGVSGYNIYRAVYTTSCGSFSKINPTLASTTAYADSSVIDGTSYCYAATAVDSSNQESGYSNIASNVQIPAP
jgi:hypothetical protein